MYIQQNQSILFFPKRNKRNQKTGKVPIYARLKIDGLVSDRVVKGVHILPEHWDTQNKIVTADDPKAKVFNRKIAQMQTDLQRHVDLVQAQQQIATPETVLAAFDAPIRINHDKEEKKKNGLFSEKLDELVKDYVIFHKKKKKAYEFNTYVAPTRVALLEEKQKMLEERIDKIDKEGNGIFDNKEWTKTIVLAINEHLLHFMKLVKAGHRAYTTLEKMAGRKARFVEFILVRYQVEDLSLAALEYKFIEQLETHCKVNSGMIQNTASKYTATFKDIITRTVSNGWTPANIFLAFPSPYKQPQREWLSWEQLYQFIDFPFSKPQYRLVRDLYVFEAFTGYAYAEIRSARPDDTRDGIDGKLWISKARQKTKADETLPFLPIALGLIDKYKTHPVCLKRGTLFPVPTNEYYNRCLKEMAKEIGFEVLLFTHSARYFFANEVLYNNGVQLKTIARIMGQDSVKSAEIYVRANRTAVSESMDMVEAKIYHPDGTLKAGRKAPGHGAKVIALRAV